MNTHSLSKSIGRSLVALGLAVSSVVACRSSPPEGERTVSARIEASRATCSANQGEQACVTCCAGTGPVRPLVQAAERCVQACGTDDKTCFEQCYAAFDTACEPLGEVCETFWTCAESCYPGCEDEGNGGKVDDKNKGAKRLLRGGDKPPNGECGDDDDDNSNDK
jgi:hypothetical protein